LHTHTRTHTNTHIYKHTQTHTRTLCDTSPAAQAILPSYDYQSRKPDLKTTLLFYAHVCVCLWGRACLWGHMSEEWRGKHHLHFYCAFVTIRKRGFSSFPPAAPALSCHASHKSHLCQVSRVNSSFSSVIGHKTRKKKAAGHCSRQNIITSASTVLPAILHVRLGALREQQ